MKPYALIPAVLALSACENGLAFPDLRGGLSGDPVTTVSDPTLQLSDRERVIAAVEANGCVISGATIGPIMAQASVNQAQLVAVSEVLEAEGAFAAPTDDGTVRLTTGNCVSL